MYDMFLITVLVFMCIYLCYWWFCFHRLAERRQKTRDPRQRGVYVGSRTRQSISQQTPTIYVSPSNLPPPPKYENMAPPSYDEVVGVHYPHYQTQINQSITLQPITVPITTAMQTPATSFAAPVTTVIPPSTTITPVTLVTSPVTTVTSPETSSPVTVTSVTNQSTSSTSNEETTVVTVKSDNKRTSVTIAC